MSFPDKSKPQRGADERRSMLTPTLQRSARRNGSSGRLDVYHSPQRLEDSNKVLQDRILSSLGTVVHKQGDISFRRQLTELRLRPQPKSSPRRRRTGARNRGENVWSPPRTSLWLRVSAVKNASPQRRFIGWAVRIIPRHSFIRLSAS